MSEARDRNYEESPSGQLEIKQLEKRIDELEAKLEHSNRHKKLHLSKYKELEAKVKSNDHNT
tara:strand:+ start:1011 stop:1196 length:186 start_codon:yes stop_codon:yes gene_type:complete